MSRITIKKIALSSPLILPRLMVGEDVVDGEARLPRSNLFTDPGRECQSLAVRTIISY